MRILITHISYHCSVGVIKLLRMITKWPIYIVGCSSYPLGMSSGSLLVDAFYESPPIEQEDDYLIFLKNLIEKQQIEFIISAEEIELKLFSKHARYFSEKTIIPSWKALCLFEKKLEASLALSQLGIEIPEIISYDSLRSSSYPNQIILRENVSCCSYGIHITHGDDLSDIDKHMTPTSFIQKFVSGSEYTVDVLCDRDGIPHFIIPRARLAIRNGITYKCRIEYEQQLIEQCKIICNHYYLPGFSNMQFIIQDKTPYFIELNPRLGGTTIASSLASVNLIEVMLSHFFFGESMPDLKKSMQCVKWGAIISRYYEETIFFEGKGI